MGLISGIILGVILGLALMAVFTYSDRRRSRERQQLVVAITGLSKLTLADTRRTLPKQLFPPWIVFSSREKVNWLNHQMIKTWPFVDQATSAFLKLRMESILQLYKPGVFASLRFQKFTLGTIAPQISGVEIVKSEENEITMEVDIQWGGNPSIILLVGTLVGVSLPVQVKDVNFVGVFRLIFKPLTDELPCFGAVTYSLRELKNLDFTLKVIGGKVTSLPGLAAIIEGWIRTAITDALVWPARQVIPILPGDYRDLELQITGILEVKLVQAKNLLNKDIIGKSDPFVILFIRPISSRMKKSRTINNDLNPIWNEHFKMEVEDVTTQSLFLRIFDEEGVQEPEFLGCAKLELRSLEPGKLTDIWLSLVKDFDTAYEKSNKYRGQVHLELIYLPFNEDMLTSEKSLRKPTSMRLTSLERVLTKKSPRNVQLRRPNSIKEVAIPRGILCVTVIRAEELATTSLKRKFQPYVILKMKKADAKWITKVIPNTINPEWNQTFHIVVEDALHDMLIIEVWDHKIFGEKYMGKCALTLTKLLQENENDIEMQLDGVKSGKVFLHLQWKKPFPSDPQYL